MLQSIGYQSNSNKMPQKAGLHRILDCMERPMEGTLKVATKEGHVYVYIINIRMIRNVYIKMVSVHILYNLLYIFSLFPIMLGLIQISVILIHKCVSWMFL
jgi:hypothetical protein